MPADVRAEDAEQLHLSDLLSRVLDKGVVIVGEVTIAVADIDLIRVKLNLLLGAVETEFRRGALQPPEPRGDVPLLPPDAGE